MRHKGYLLAACWCVAAVAAGQEAPRATIDRMFASAASSSTAAVAATGVEYKKLQRLRPDDPRIDYAYALALLQQHRYREALPLVEKYLAINPADLPAVRTRIWAELQLQQNDQAIDHCVQLSGRLASAQLSPAEAQDAAQFLGTAIGFLEFTRDAFSDPEKSELKNRILATLGKRELKSFDEGRLAVIERLAELQAIQQQRIERTSAKKEALKTRTAEALEASRTQIEASDQTVQMSTESLRDAQRQLAVIRSQLQSLNSDRAILSGQIATIQGRINEIQFAILQNSQNQGRATVSLEDSVRLPNMAIALAALNKQAFDMDRRILSLRTTASQLLKQGAQSGQIAASGQQDLRQAETRAENLEKQLSRMEREKGSSKPRLTPQMRMLTSYMPSPAEQEQARIMAWFP